VSSRGPSASSWQGRFQYVKKPLFPIKPIGGSPSPGDPMALSHVFGDEFNTQAREARRVITPTLAVDDCCQKRYGCRGVGPNSHQENRNNPLTSLGMPGSMLHL